MATLRVGCKDKAAAIKGLETIVMLHILEVKSISESYPGVLAVDNISFSLENSEALALLSENSAGKSID